MSKKILSILLASSLAASSLACKSSRTAAEVPCTCGTPESDIEGCAHATCLAGKTNSENPDCVCGALSIPK